MAAVNLKGMDVDALLALRADIDKRLSQKRSELEKQLSRLSAETAHAPGIYQAVLGGVSARRGRQRALRSRGPGGEPGPGRGARAGCFAAIKKKAHKRDDFAQNRAVTPRRGHRAKKPRRKKK